MVKRSLPTRRRRGSARHRRALLRVAALVTLAAVSCAWTASLVSSPEASRVGLPAAPTVPLQALESPASVTAPGGLADAGRGGSPGVATVTRAGDVPAAASSAYHRATQVIDGADPGCHLDWTILAAIGRVESDHGRYGDNVLGPDGRSRPGIYGVPLDGRRGTARIEDTDAGLLDRDQVFDRAVGPLQFIPTTWSEVGVDADGDGKRDPQDIDDASLAAAVYLCAGAGDLSTRAGQVDALLRYNHSRSYVRLVRSLAHSYAAGHATVPLVFPSAVRLSPRQDDLVGGSGPVRGGRAPVVRGPAASGAVKAPTGNAASPSSSPVGPEPAPSPVRKPSKPLLPPALQEVAEGAAGTVLGTATLLGGVAGELLGRRP